MSPGGATERGRCRTRAWTPQLWLSVSEGRNSGCSRSAGEPQRRARFHVPREEGKRLYVFPAERVLSFPGSVGSKPSHAFPVSEAFGGSGLGLPVRLTGLHPHGVLQHPVPQSLWLWAEGVLKQRGPPAEDGI